MVSHDGAEDLRLLPRQRHTTIRTMATMAMAIYLRLLPQQSELCGGGLPHAEAVDELLVRMAIVSIAIVSIAKAC